MSVTVAPAAATLASPTLSRRTSWRTRSWRRPSVIPGFGITFGFTLTYLSLIVLIPLAALVLRTTELSWQDYWTIATNDRVLASLKLSFGAAAIGAVLNTVFGLIVAWVLVRYEFIGK